MNKQSLKDTLFSKGHNKDQEFNKSLELPAVNDSKLNLHEEKNDSIEYNQPLVSKKKEPISKSLLQKLKNCWKKKAAEESRLVYLNGKSSQRRHVPNVVKNQKYSIFTFIPLVLYNQFRFFFNLFYLLIALTQFIPPLKVGFLFTYVGPLGLVLFLTMIKEGYDDFQRYKRDKEANSSLYSVILPGGKTKQKPSSKLRVGDIIEIHPNQRIPADLILLHSSEESGSVFIKTDQLDGETDWKLRKAIRYTQQLFSSEKFDISQLNASVTYQLPSENIYFFEGLFYANEYSSDAKLNEPLFLDHTLWANTSITAGKVLGLVIYTGRETRSMMNSRQPRSKIGKLDMELNLITKLLFTFMIFLAGVIVALNGFYGKWYLQYFRYVLLMASIIPISLRVNLDFAKTIFSFKINRDQSIPGTIARNSNIPEELGRICFLLTDKTGTLTKNDMHFKKIILEQVQYEEDNVNLIAKIIKAQCEKSDGPLKDVEEKAREVIQPTMSFERMQKPRKTRRDKENVLRDLITAFAVCNNVTPLIEDGKRNFQASSPDEIALVSFAQDVKMRLVSRTNDQMHIQNPAGQKEIYDILAIFPFSSETKRMGILVRHQNTKRIIFFLKGADIAIQPRVKEVYRAMLLDECEALARTGLRTMVFAQKLISEEEYQNWAKIWEEAYMSLTKRDERMRKAADLLETDMEFIGISGVEDRLQDDINVTLESLRNAGIKIWMLTGDKIETAKCIAISTGLKSIKHDIYEIKDIEDELEMQNKINEFSNRIDTVLLIDGHSLSRVLEMANHEKFFEAAVRAPAVICSRCLPTQKAIVTEMVKKYSGKRVACIGDGGNDVGMIQSADLGIGIVGKEGKQASLASDFSIYEFQYIKPLILWHGRLYYKNAAKLSQFVIHRGLIISFIQALFISVFYFVAIPIYNGMLMLGYTTIYTMFPVFSLIFDQDVDREKALNYPALYKTLQLSRELNSKTFLVWLWKSLFQASVIVMMSFYLFPDSFVKIVTITFTALILSEILNVYTELHKLHAVMIIAFLGTIGVYFASIVLLREYIDVDAITNDFLSKICMIVSVSWLPLHIARHLVRCYDPSDYQKVMQTI